MLTSLSSHDPSLTPGVEEVGVNSLQPEEVSRSSGQGLTGLRPSSTTEDTRRAGVPHARPPEADIDDHEISAPPDRPVDVLDRRRLQVNLVREYAVVIGEPARRTACGVAVIVDGQQTSNLNITLALALTLRLP